MKIAHIADPHLGYRAYNRINKAGLNAREADVFSAFRQALHKAAEINADAILIAGDLFHVVRPSNLTIQHTFREFAGIRNKTDAPIIILGGNHDSPRSVDTGCILDLFANLPEIYVAHSEYVQVKLKKLDMSVFCLCHRAVPQISQLKIEPDSTSKYNVLMVHGTLEGVIKHAYDVHEIHRADVISDAWDYVAFGHYHVFEELAPNAYYAGSTEYTSTNIWNETKVPKGFIEYDLDEHKLVQFHKTKTRDVVDLRPIDASDAGADDINKMIMSRIDSINGGYENKVVRLIVENLPRSVQGDLDFASIRKIRSEALHFELQLRPPSRSGVAASNDTGITMSLEEEWNEFGKTYEIPADVNRDSFIELGRNYLSRQVPAE